MAQLQPDRFVGHFVHQRRRSRPPPRQPHPHHALYLHLCTREWTLKAIVKPEGQKSNFVRTTKIWLFCGNSNLLSRTMEDFDFASVDALAVLHLAEADWGEAE